ncbi:MAG TPA: universal stress protein [Thermoanaerobaculia bacterium]|nr:universal stress protein [Thermoanaerobaculia bacterium]
MAIKRILAATDFDELATVAVRYAADLARSAGAELIILFADPFAPPPEFTVDQVDNIAAAIEQARVRALQELNRYAESLIGNDISWRAIVAVGTPAASIIRTAQEEHADLIAMGTHGRSGLRRLLLGSVAERVMREAPVPLLTIRNPAP